MELQWQKLDQRALRPFNFRHLADVTYRLPDGKTAHFDILLDRPVAVILALTDTNQVILAKQFRPGIGKVLWEMPGGLVDQGETPELAAARELYEETGYQGELQLAGSSYPDGYSQRITYSFVALNCQFSERPKGTDHEFIEPSLVTINEFRQLLRQGAMTDVAAGYQGLDFLNLL